MMKEKLGQGYEAMLDHGREQKTTALSSIPLLPLLALMPFARQHAIYVGGQNPSLESRGTRGPSG